MDPELRKSLKTVLEAVKHLLDIFKYERFLHIGAGVLALLALLYAIVRMLESNEAVGVGVLTALFGASGLVTVSIARITYFFDRAFTLMDDVIRKLLNI